MRRSRFSAAEKLRILDAERSGTPANVLCRTYGISRATLFRWKREAQRALTGSLEKIEELERDNAALRASITSLERDVAALRAVIEGKD
ncbi:MAG TPA: transposase [Alphaproteobacteria bacterium]|nr:transposase [Alphaproteobacteria bacterium]